MTGENDQRERTAFMRTITRLEWTELCRSARLRKSVNRVYQWLEVAAAWERQRVKK